MFLSVIERARERAWRCTENFLEKRGLDIEQVNRHELREDCTESDQPLCIVVQRSEL